MTPVGANGTAASPLPGGALQPPGAPQLAVVLVHYHAPGAVAMSVEALRRDLEASRIAAEWLVVDNGSTPEERAALEAVRLPILDGGGNLGFAAGVNRGVASTVAETLLLLNPDVEVLPGCARALCDELDRGAGAAAPRLYWDPGRRFLLPPGEPRSRSWELLALGAKRSERCARRARRSSRRDARRHWCARGGLDTVRLSGAALAIARAAWSRVGPFDEGYRLYFEETDWLLRLRASGLAARQAAGAEAVHSFAHSTRSEPQARTWFEESARRFRAHHYGSWFVKLHDRLSRAVGAAVDRPVLPRWRPDALLSLSARVPPERPVWLELSPNREGFPAAGELVPGSSLGVWRPPFELMRASGLGGVSLTAASDGGRELGRWWIAADAEP